ncbi:MAG: hypothetical protein JW751_18345 [Polyangiaceae bacterium]|nr:hypothetical protein [Polyangiaceae bacterium]
MIQRGKWSPCWALLAAGAACQSGVKSGSGAVSAQPAPEGAVEPVALASATMQPPLAARAPDGAAATPPASVAGARSAQVGTDVVVTGLFLGWKGPCKGVPPSRSAWHLADGAAADAPCLYVDGRLPDGASATNPPAGFRVTVTGRVRASDSGRFLEASAVERAP